MILLSAEASSKEISLSQRTREAAETNVLALSFCESHLAAEDKMGKKRLEEVHTFAELKHDPRRSSFPKSFTACSSLMTTGCQSQKWPTFFNILYDNNGQLLSPFIRHGNVESGLGIGLHSGNSQILTGTLPTLFPNHWTSSCISINATSGLIRWVVDGTLVLAKEFVEMQNPRNQPKNVSKRIVLGARSNGDSWFASTQRVTNLDIFSSPFPIDKMKSLTQGENCVREGDYLSWRDMEWILHGQARIETMERKEVCERDPLVDLFYTSFPGMDSCMHHCQNLGSRVPSIATLEEWTKLQTFLKTNLYDKGLNTMEIWLPIEDRQTEDVWKDFYTGEVVQNYTHPWAGSKPNGGRSENCARLVNEKQWNDRECENPFYACMCLHKSTRTLKLRGLCPGSAIDVYYKPINKETDVREMKLQGLTHSIEYAEKVWRLNVINSDVTGISSASFASFTLGKHNWTIKGDDGCSSADTYITELKMSGCQANEYTCNDGQCVSMDDRCNQLPNCRDESDERNCNVLVLKDGYNKNVPPIPVNVHDKVNISVSIDLLKLVDIDEVDYSIEIQFKITLHWKENRATYHNLKENDNLNALTQNDIETLWLPIVIYENTNQKETTRLGEFGNGEWKTKVVVRREGNSSSGGLQMVDETEIFCGSENTLIMSQTYTHRFQCAYELAYYPFDTQVQSKLCHSFLHIFF